MLWTIGFMITFVVGGVTGVLMAVPAADFVLHNSLFLIAHFHNVIIGGVVFGCMAAINYWFPKAFGFRLNERWGKASFWCWLIGFYVAFVPLYILGLKGMTRRMNHYANPEWQPYLIVALVGAVIIAMGIFFTVLQFYVSVRDRKKLTDPSGDPWGGRTLEWSISSPAPFYNFALLPQVRDLDQFWEDKQNGVAYVQPAKYEDIHMPRNTGVGVFMGAFGTALGFALVWHIWWLAAFGLLGMIASFIVRAYDRDVDYWVPAAEVERIERSRHAQLQQFQTTQVAPAAAPSRQKVA
jgi:cytochrome o ubiquinol oxidase subunit 1